jgi:lysophospholipase L1-like esterase
LFVRDQTGRYYYLNPDLSKKYFTVRENATLGYRELFPVEKPPGAVRIFVLGASTSIGFPYMHNGAFSRLLTYRLQFDSPDTPFEVINLSLTAVNSYTLYDFAKQLIHYAPDAVLIYAGHNEYYGALGVASTSRIGRATGWVRATVAARDFKLGQGAFAFAALLKGAGGSTVDYSRTLMERMAGEQSIPFQSKLFRQGIEQYDNNLGDMLAGLDAHRIPVFVATLVSIQRGLEPFVSSADSLSASKAYEAAEAHYLRGEYALAKEGYIKAKEYDELRFRAPERMNEIIRKHAARRSNVHLVDVMKKFEDNAAHGILDTALLLEHVHPNLKGQRLIAEAFYESLKESDLLPEAPKHMFAYAVAASDYPFTAFDTIYGEVATTLLKELWPFNRPIPSDYFSGVKSYEKQIAGATAVKQIGWNQSMHHLYDYYQQRGDKANALRIIEGLCLDAPYEEAYMHQAGKLGLQQDEDAKAWFYFTKAYKLHPTSDAASQVAIALLKMDRPREAMPYIDFVIGDTGAKVDFGPMKEVAQQIIACKDSLDNRWGDPGSLRRNIGAYYALIGNLRVAQTYSDP